MYSIAKRIGHMIAKDHQTMPAAYVQYRQLSFVLIEIKKVLTRAVDEYLAARMDAISDVQFTYFNDAPVEVHQTITSDSKVVYNLVRDLYRSVLNDPQGQIRQVRRAFFELHAGIEAQDWARAEEARKTLASLIYETDGSYGPNWPEPDPEFDGQEI